MTSHFVHNIACFATTTGLSLSNFQTDTAVHCCHFFGIQDFARTWLAKRLYQFCTRLWPIWYWLFPMLLITKRKVTFSKCTKWKVKIIPVLHITYHRRFRNDFLKWKVWDQMAKIERRKGRRRKALVIYGGNLIPAWQSCPLGSVKYDGEIQIQISKV